MEGSAIVPHNAKQRIKALSESHSRPPISQINDNLKIGEKVA